LNVTGSEFGTDPLMTVFVPPDATWLEQLLSE
jgi:hypothetical protein